VTVTAVPDAPIANNDSTNMLEDASVTIKVLGNDLNPDGGVLTLTGVTTADGVAVISGTNVVFTPAANFNGTAVLSYTISNATASATNAYATPDNTPLTVPAPGVLGNDTDVDSAALTAVLVAGVTHGSLALNADGSFVYVPATNFFGSDSFTYRAFDGIVTSAVTTVSINTTSSVALRFVSQQMTPAGFRLQLAGPSLAVYTILTSTNHTVWTPVSTNVALTGSVVFTDTRAIYDSMCFYGASIGTQATSILLQNATTGNKQYLTAGRKGAQSFRYGTAGGPSYTLSKVHFHLSRSATLPNTNLNFSIGTTTNAGALAGSSFSINPASITNTSAGVSFQDFDIVFNTPVGPLAAGTTYYLNLDCEAANLGRVYLESTGVGTAYANGVFYRSGSAQADDLVFELWGQ
jgi:hypothetical protein